MKTIAYFVCSLKGYSEQSSEGRAETLRQQSVHCSARLAFLPKAPQFCKTSSAPHKGGCISSNIQSGSKRSNNKVGNACAQQQVSSTQLSLHIAELKSRAVYVCVALLSSFCVAYHKATQLTYMFLLSFSTTSLEQKSFIFTDIYEAFSSTIYICSIASGISVVPLFIYQSLCFFLPSWYTYERFKRCKRVLFLSLFAVCYMYFVQSFVLPRLCQFLLQFQLEKDCLVVSVEPRIVSYVLWTTHLLVIAALLFVFVGTFYLCALSGLIDLKQYSQKRAFYSLLCMVLASIISPPELWSQFFLALLLFLLCEFILFFCFVKHHVHQARKTHFHK